MSPSTSMKQEDLPLNAGLLQFIKGRLEHLNIEATIILYGNHTGIQQQYTLEKLSH